MILYLDTSALVKRYFKEAYTDDVIDKWREAEEIVTSSVAYAEAMAAFFRKKREADIDAGVMRRLIEDLREDWYSFIRIRVDDELNSTIERMTARYSLRGFDAIHLSSALVVHEKFKAELLFMCFDVQLAEAAADAGIRTFQRLSPNPKLN
jgi:uncharacterized protein